MNNSPDNPQALTDPLLGPGGRREKFISWLRRNSTIILAIIIIIVIGAGIYAYTRGPQPISEIPLEQGIVVTEGTGETESPEGPSEREGTEEIIINPETEGIGGPEAEVYTETAQAGEGITHLARKALKEYLQTKDESDLTAEHKIYIEDYLQNKTGIEPLEIGDQRSFSIELIEEAITMAKNLTQEQLENLEQYSQLVPSL